MSSPEIPLPPCAVNTPVPFPTLLAQHPPPAFPCSWIPASSSYAYSFLVIACNFPRVSSLLPPFFPPTLHSTLEYSVTLCYTATLGLSWDPFISGQWPETNLSCPKVKENLHQLSFVLLLASANRSCYRVE